ncbi:MAG: hypothetical protein QOE88_2131 [Verrucomicrobiota bacterium]|nr:hypothetical protein [Verrucomicrobiota bacterium]
MIIEQNKNDWCWDQEIPKDEFGHPREEVSAETGEFARRIRKRGVRSNSGPFLDHEIELFHEGIDFFKILSTSFFGFQIEGPAKGDHISEIANAGGGRNLLAFGFLQNGISDPGKLSFDPGRISVDRFAKRFADEFQFLREGFHR